jgi:hypothetical protein
MKKDGTRYLCLIETNDGKLDWDVIHWGTPIGFSDYYGTKGWLNRIGFSLKIKSIKSFKSLPNNKQ